MIVLATGNPHKVDELRAILAPAGIQICGLKDLPHHDRFHEPVEHGSTFAENARIKALSYAQQTGQTCLADDSGIEIDALALPNGTPRPGVISSHYCTDGEERGMSRAERDANNNARVLRELEGVPAARRSARFVCCMCLARPGQVLHETRGEFSGEIGIPPRVPSGAHGFGYDPLFLVAADPSHTAAELGPEAKNLLSHRAKAAGAMMQWIADSRLHTEHARLGST